MTAHDLDLSPRPAPRQATPRKGRNWAAIGVLVAVVAAGAVILTKFLGSAIDYYCNADEIGVRDGCEEGRRLRVQGTVADGSVASQGGITTFTIVFGNAAVPVRYEGEPGGIFAECEPVVVHGRLVGDVFEGDEVEVKHDNEYAAENPERVDDAGRADCPTVSA
jgi:cytochrome c-type biogenesis protein CcmE